MSGTPAAATSAGAAGPAVPAPPPVSVASLCVRLGWTVTDLYVNDFADDAPTPVGQLPQATQLTARQQFALNAARANMCATRIAAIDEWSGSAPTLAESCSDADWTAYGVSVDRSDPISAQVLAFHLAVTTQLTTAGGVLPKAYQLGQALARLCRSKAGPVDLYAAFDVDELVRIDQDLTDLATALPEHAAKSVITSLTWWRDAVTAAQPTGPPPTPMVRALGDRRSDAPVLARRFVRNQRIADATVDVHRLVLALPRQGDLWRSVLVGEKDPLDLLGAEDYIAASKELSIQARSLLRKLPAAVWQIFVAVTVFFAVVGVGGYWIAGHGTDVSGGGRYAATVSALAATVAAWVAALWKVVSLRMKAVVAALEKPLWEAALDHVCGVAISLPPVGPADDDDRWMKLAEVAAKSAQKQIAPGTAG